MQYTDIAHLTAEAKQGTTQGTVLAQVTRKTERETKTGKPYLEFVLGDATGSINLKIWNNTAWYASCCAAEQGSSIAATAIWRVTDFGMEATDLDLRPLTPEEEDTLLAGGPELRATQEAAWQTIRQLVEGLQDPRLSTLCRAFLEQFESRIRRSGAARSVHHARRGGLVEHICGVMKNADAICRCYPKLNRDLVLAGALFHDCGKMWENAYEEHSLVMPYTEMGELLGHIPLGIELINALWKKIYTETKREEWRPLSPASEHVRLHLLHLIASHHGSMEFGSPVLPKTPEALALHHADDLDAKMEMMRAAYAESPELAPRIFQRKPPLPSNLVSPLPSIRQD